MWKGNYHTHTTRCKHARDSDEDYVIKAIQAGFKEIGFADHCPWPFEDGYVSPMRMDVAQLEDYVSSVKSLQEKYQGQIDVKLGLECEYFETMIPWLVAEKERLSIDYLIFGNHFPEIESNHYYDHTPGDSVKAIKDYLRVSLQGIESEIFAYMAHPDVFMRGYKTFDSHCEEVAYRLCEKAKEYQLPLEYNLAGYTNGGYPHPEFWKIAKEVGCSCIIGIDAHESATLTNTEIYERALLEIDALGLTRIDRLFFA